jgi:hypothetical protein
MPQLHHKQTIPSRTYFLFPDTIKPLTVDTIKPQTDCFTHIPNRQLHQDYKRSISTTQLQGSIWFGGGGRIVVGGGGPIRNPVMGKILGVRNIS